MAGKIGDYNTALVLAQAGPEDMNREVGMRELPLGNYAYSVFRLQREFGRSATVGLLGANKQNGSDYDRTSGIDARFVLPENLEVNLEYANEWKTGLDRSQAVFAELSREANFFSFKAKYFDVGRIVISGPTKKLSCPLRIPKEFLVRTEIHLGGNQP